MQQQAAPPTCPIPPAPAYYEDGMSLDSLIRAAWRTQYQAFQIKMHGNLDSALDEPNNRPKLHKKGLSRGEMIRRQRNEDRSGGSHRRDYEDDTDEDMRGDNRNRQSRFGVHRGIQRQGMRGYDRRDDRGKGSGHRRQNRNVTLVVNDRGRVQRRNDR
ncbi:hypothetical protein FOL47_011230 [Perkinsus chesapeaki]|uniref:Uncharacterized protein n=1 Tax=Perkinsus chesapeaki TaxID=330153 RepID=A0A7J6KYH7_PERCH|nr:hypothetical protein FOL47_011230 [Perkinsus chesapeaki]